MADDQIQGLPAGAVVEDVPQAAAPTTSATPAPATPAPALTPTTQIQGLPPGAVVEDMHTPTPQPQGPSIHAAPPMGVGERMLHVFSDSAVGHALESTFPEVTRDLGLTPTETVNAPGYEAHQNQLLNPIAAMSPSEQAAHPIVAGAADVAGGLTTPGSVLALAGSGGLGELPGMAGKIVPRLVSAGFSTAQVASALKEIPAFRVALADGDTATAERIMTHMTLDVAAAAMGGQHAAAGEAKPLWPGMDNAITDFMTKAPEAIRNKIGAAVSSNPNEPTIAERAGDAVTAAKEKIFGTPEEQAKTQADKLAKETEAVHGDLKTAIPPSKAAMYDDNDMANARPFLEEQHAIKPINSVEGVRDAADASVDKIEGKVREYIAQNPTDQINGDILGQIKKMISGNEREGFADKGLKSLANLNLDKPLTVERADSIREQLNSENTAQMKKNSYSRYDARTADPKFAAREAAAEVLRDGVYDKLAERGIKDVDILRKQEGSLLRIRDAAENNILTGDRVIEGTAGTAKGIIRKGLERGSAIAGAAAGSVLGPVGAAAGAGAGAVLGEGVNRIAGLNDLTRDELAERSFGKKVTTGPNYPIVSQMPRNMLQLPAPAIQVGQAEAAPVGPPAINIEPTTRATRLGLILPAAGESSPENSAANPTLGQQAPGGPNMGRPGLDQRAPVDLPSVNIGSRVQEPNAIVKAQGGRASTPRTDTGPYWGQIALAGAPEGEGMTFRTDNNGTRWAKLGDLPEVSIPKQLKDPGDIVAYARKVLDLQKQFIESRKASGKQ